MCQVLFFVFLIDVLLSSFVTSDMYIESLECRRKSWEVQILIKQHPMRTSDFNPLRKKIMRLNNLILFGMS